MSTLKVIQPGNPVAKEILAEAIVKIGQAAEALKASGLNEEAIVILLQAKTKVGKRDIETVLHGLRRLRGWYCR